jgi:hypothetical protein
MKGMQIAAGFRRDLEAEVGSSLAFSSAFSVPHIKELSCP